MQGTVERIRDDDPSFDPVALACSAAAIPRPLFFAALNRVVYDGYYGPVRPEAWIEAHDRGEHAKAVAQVSEALSILARVSDKIEGYREIFYAIDDDGSEIEWTEEVATAEEIRRDLLATVYDIYGHLPW